MRFKISDQVLKGKVHYVSLDKNIEKHIIELENMEDVLESYALEVDAKSISDHDSSDFEIGNE